MYKIFYSLLLCLGIGFLNLEAQTKNVRISIIGPPDIKLMQEINDAWATLNPENASIYYDKSPNNIFYDSSPFNYIGWTSYSNGAKELFKDLASMEYIVNKDAIVRINGDIAFGNATLHLATIDKAGNKNMVDLRWTIIWEKKENNWLIVHEHLSVPADTSE